MTETPRDVFIVANSVWEMGGAIRFAHTLAGLLASRGHRVRLVGAVPTPDTYPYGDDLPYETFVIHRKHPPPPANPRMLATLSPRLQFRRLRRAMAFRIGVRRLTRYLAAGRPGGIVIVCQVFAMEWVRRADTHGMHVIGMSHESFAASSDSTRYGRVLRNYADVDRLLLLTQADSDSWAMRGLTNVGVMPNPLGLHAERVAGLDDKVVISLGRFSPEKGFDYLIDAWARVAPEHPDWTLRLYGDGPAEDDLRAQVDRLGLTGSVAFMGRTNDVPSALLASSIYALSSRQEGMPVVLMEAMEFGLPCVAFDVSPGVREIVTHDIDGVVVAPGRPAELADGLRRLMADATLRQRFGKAAHESVQRFAPDKIVARWEREFVLLDR